jgi:hypothetical protein
LAAGTAAQKTPREGFAGRAEFVCIKEKKMTNKKRFFIGCAACFGAALLSLAGCSTTQAISFSASRQPAGEYKHAVIDASVTGDAGSVLQRFYAQYPADQYEVIACELQSKNYLPVLAGTGAGLLASLIALPIAFNSTDIGEGLAVAGVGFGLTIPAGILLGNHFKDTYIVTYIERAAPPDDE